MRAALEKISYTVADSYISSRNVAYTERILPGGERFFRFMSMTSEDEEERFALTLPGKDKTETKLFGVKFGEIKEFLYQN